MPERTGERGGLASTMRSATLPDSTEPTLSLQRSDRAGLRVTMATSVRSSAFSERREGTRRRLPSSSERSRSAISATFSSWSRFPEPLGLQSVPSETVTLSASASYTLAVRP
jgi:hypothetical protein